MTEIAFHFNVPDKLGYACRLIRKVWLAGHRVVVTGTPATLQALDVALWTASPQEFIPHCMGTASPEMLSATPVVFQAELAQAVHHDVLVSLHPEVQPGFEAFVRVVEVVSKDDEDRSQARMRWRHYQQQGFNLVQHDLAKIQSS